MPEEKPKTSTGGQNNNPGTSIKVAPVQKPKKGTGKLEFINELPITSGQPSPTNEPAPQLLDNGDEESNGDQGYSEQEGSETLGEQEHEMAMKRQLDQQKKIDSEFKSEQDASAEPKKTEQTEPEKNEAPAEKENDDENEAPPDKPYAPPPGTNPDDVAPGKKPSEQEDQGQEEKQADWQRKSVLQRAAIMKRAAMEKDQEKQKQAADQVPDPAQAGPEQTLKRVFQGKCFSCTGCIGILHRLALDFHGASSLYAVLDLLWTDENTDKCFSCACCCNVLSVILVLAAPILIGIGLALLAAKALDSIIDIKTIMSFF